MYLSKILSLPQATVGRYLLKYENENYLKQIGNKGRVLTEEGEKFLSESIVNFKREKTANNLINIVFNEEALHLEEVIEVRMLLEVYAVEQACQKATDEDLAELDRIMLEYVREVRYGGSGDELDLQTHLKLAKISKNTVVYQILKIILTQDNEYARFASVSEKKGNIQTCLEQHESIVNAVKNRDAEAAVQAMKLHLNKVMRDISGNSEKTTDQSISM